ncbi:ATP-binding protein [Pyrococcus kukulkanii]|uniref:AAA family ATPase n=1 Tax=Pyrococcus kukulkanii TaxID=1609559 RepID=UPI003562A657
MEQFPRGTILPLNKLAGRNVPRSDLGMSEVDYLIDNIKEKEWTAITGPRLVGKTTLAKSVAYHLRDTEGWTVVYLNVSGVKDFKDFVVMTYAKLPKRVKLKLILESALFSGIKVGITGEGIYGGAILENRIPPVQALVNMLQFLGKKSIVIWDEIQELKTGIPELMASLWKLRSEVDDIEELPSIIVTGSSVGVLSYFIEPTKIGFGGESLSSGVHFVGREFDNLNLEPLSRQTTIEYLANGLRECNVNYRLVELEEIYEFSMGLPGIVNPYGRKRCKGLSHSKALQYAKRVSLSKIREEILNILRTSFPKSWEKLAVALSLYSKNVPLKEISRRTGASLSTIYEMLEELTNWGYLEKSVEGRRKYKFKGLAYLEAAREI